MQIRWAYKGKSGQVMNEAIRFPTSIPEWLSVYLLKLRTIFPFTHSTPSGEDDPIPKNSPPLDTAYCSPHFCKSVDAVDQMWQHTNQWSSARLIWVK